MDGRPTEELSMVLEEKWLDTATGKQHLEQVFDASTSAEARAAGPMSEESRHPEGRVVGGDPEQTRQTILRTQQLVAL
jgi:hypothetical protein